MLHDRSPHARSAAPLVVPKVVRIIHRIRKPQPSVYWAQIVIILHSVRPRWTRGDVEKSVCRGSMWPPAPASGGTVSPRPGVKCPNTGLVTHMVSSHDHPSDRLHSPCGSAAGPSFRSNNVAIPLTIK